jgi:hypothetical protein
VKAQIAEQESLVPTAKWAAEAVTDKKTTKTCGTWASDLSCHLVYDDLGEGSSVCYVVPSRAGEDHACGILPVGNMTEAVPWFSMEHWLSCCFTEFSDATTVALHEASNFQSHDSSWWLPEVTNHVSVM